MGDWAVVKDNPAPTGGSDWQVVPEAAAAPNPPLPGLSPGVVSSALHGASNPLGAGQLISAGIEHTLNKVLPESASRWLSSHGVTSPLPPDASFAQRRDFYNQDFSNAAKAHPVAYGIGETAGTLATPGLGLAGEAATAATGSKLAGALAEGATVGGASAATNAAATGQAPVEGLKATAQGAELGALGGAALHGISKVAGAATEKASQALRDKYVQTFGSEVLGSTSKKGTVKAWSAVLGKAPEEGVEEKAAQKYVQSREMQPVEAAARHGKYDQAIEEVDKNLARYSPGRIANYGAVEDTKPFEVGKGLDEIDRALFNAANGKKDHAAVAALQKARTEWVGDFSSADARAVQQALLHPDAIPQGVDATKVADELRAVVDKLPQTGAVSRTALTDAANEAGASADTIRYIASRVTDPEQGLMHWDPKATLPALELRAQASMRQDSASQAFDALNPRASEHAKTVVKRAIVSALEKHLDEVAATSDRAAEVVKRIRNDDVRFSVLLAARRGLQEGAEKAQRNQLQTSNLLRQVLKHGAGTLPAAALAADQGADAADSFENGRPLRGYIHAGAAVAAGGLAAHQALRPISIGHNRLSTALATPAAQALVQKLAQRLPGAVTGAVTSTTLGQANGQ